MSGLIEGTNIMLFIKKTAVPANSSRDIKYGQIVVDYRQENTDPYQNRLTVGGDRVNYPVYFDTPTVYLTTAKILLNIIVSTLNTKFMKIDVKYFYLNTTMAQSKYMCLKIRYLPKSMVQHFNL